jgi:hypothetical protein
VTWVPSNPEWNEELARPHKVKNVCKLLTRNHKLKHRKKTSQEHIFK